MNKGETRHRTGHGGRYELGQGVGFYSKSGERYWRIEVTYYALLFRKNSSRVVESGLSGKGQERRLSLTGGFWQ